METNIPVPELDDVDIEFGSVEHLPKWEDIPKEFRKDFFRKKIKWTRIAVKWEDGGVDFTQFVAKPGIDKKKAIRALGAILISWDPKEAHKIAGVAYLMSLWFDLYKGESNLSK